MAQLDPTDPTETPMTDPIPDLSIDLSAVSVEDWHDRIAELGEEHGYYEKLGPDHSVLFVDAGPQLLVTFETRSAIKRLPRCAPRGFDLVKRNGWSLLALIAEDEGWFRAPRIWGYFDRKVDDGFFEDFDCVTFYGHHAAGYAACAYSVAAPGARVLALRPVATLDPAVTGWDRRYKAQRRLDFTSRYGYAPDMLDAADRAHIVHDPHHASDAIHASLFRRPNVTPLACRHAGSRIEQLFDQMQMTGSLIESTMDGSLDETRFASLWRRRRDCLPYLTALRKRLEADHRQVLVARLFRHGVRTPHHAHFARELNEAGDPTPPHQSASAGAPPPDPGRKPVSSVPRAT